ncbi:MAG: Bro-N domain-containing protein [Desulfovibrionaceae bacterium]|nr:Bro-N domain-containing protein [Desulfovibrionaceae bacterium]
MANSSIASLTVFDNGESLTYVEKNGEILFTAEEIGRHLGYSDPAEAVGRLFRRNRNELKLYAVPVKLTATDGKAYDTRLFTEEGVYILSMLARTNEAKKFRARVALLLRRLRGEAMARAVELAREAALEQGRQTGRKEALATRRRDSPAYRALIRRALRYRGLGLELREIGKLMDCSHQKIFYMLKDAALLGLGVCGRQDGGPNVICEGV